jgi:hypothetical protein
MAHKVAFTLAQLSCQILVVLLYEKEGFFRCLTPVGSKYAFKEEYICFYGRNTFDTY